MKFNFENFTFIKKNVATISIKEFILINIFPAIKLIGIKARIKLNRFFY